MPGEVVAREVSPCRVGNRLPLRPEFVLCAADLPGNSLLKSRAFVSSFRSTGELYGNTLSEEGFNNNRRFLVMNCKEVSVLGQRRRVKIV